jgi:hypothetical protein
MVEIRVSGGEASANRGARRNQSRLSGKETAACFELSFPRPRSPSFVSMLIPTNRKHLPNWMHSLQFAMVTTLN